MGSKPWREELGDVDEDGGHLYDRVKMLYKEGYKPKSVLPQGMEDAISIISNLSSPCLKHEFSYSQQFCFVTNVATVPDSSFSEHERPPPPEQEANASTGESSNAGGYPCQSTNHC